MVFIHENRYHICIIHANEFRLRHITVTKILLEIEGDVIHRQGLSVTH